MSGVEVSAYAKLNLCLDVVGSLPDGYHAMKMVMQTVSLCDTVRLELNDSGRVSSTANFGFLPRDERNLAVRAAKAFLAAAGLPASRGVAVTLRKRIPVGAGMGGGSADAAAVLRGLNAMTGAGLSDPVLAELGAGLGSDVPFCLRGGTSLATGRGERLAPLPPLPDCGVVICKPRFSIRTPELFARIDGRRSRIHPDTDGLIAALEAGDLEGVARRMYNVFEDVLPRSFAGEVTNIKNALLDAGALGAVMTGTGSAVFGIFADAPAAERTAAALKQCWRECYSAVPISAEE